MMLYKRRREYIVWDARRQRLYITAMAMCEVILYYILQQSNFYCFSWKIWSCFKSEGSMGYILTHCGIDGYGIDSFMLAVLSTIRPLNNMT